MTLPTRDQLFEETDRRYYERYPDGPQKIDPDNPDHNSYEAAWLEIRDQVLNEWTDQVFYEFFPTAGKLDPSNPDDQQLMEYWNDIHAQICGEQGRWGWDSPSVAPTQTSTPAIYIVRVERDNYQGGFLVDFSGEVDDDQAKAILWPNGMPSSASVESLSPYQKKVRLDIEALRQMPDDIARLFSEAGILTAD